MPSVFKRMRMMRDHRWAPGRMSDYVDDDLSPRERTRLERHAAECPECGPMLDTLEKMVVELHGVRDAGGSPVAEAILRSVRERLDAPDEQQGS